MNIFERESKVRAFSGAILGRDHDVTLPTVARIDGENLILYSSTGTLGKWPLDRVNISVVGNGHFEVVAQDRRLSLIVDEPDAFEKALVAKRALGARASRVRAGEPVRTRRQPRRLSRFLMRRSRHGRVSLRPFPLGVVIAAVLTLGYFVGTAIGDLVDLATTESPESPDSPRADIVVRTLQGSGDEISAPFAVVAPWRVAWSVEGPDGARLEVTLRNQDGERNDLGVEEGPGQGEVTLDADGEFVLEIRSTAGAVWSVQVVEIANPDST